MSAPEYIKKQIERIAYDYGTGDLLTCAVEDAKRIASTMKLSLSEGETGAVVAGYILAKGYDRDVTAKLLGDVYRQYNVGNMALPSVTFSELRDTLASKGVDVGEVDLTDVKSEQEALDRIAAHEAEVAAKTGDVKAKPVERIDFDGCANAQDARERLRAAGRDDLAERI